MSTDEIQTISFPGNFEKLAELRERIEKEIAEGFQVPWSLLRERRKRGYTASIVKLMQIEFNNELVRRFSNCKFPIVNTTPK